MRRGEPHHPLAHCSRNHPAPLGSDSSRSCCFQQRRGLANQTSSVKWSAESGSLRWPGVRPWSAVTARRLLMAKPEIEVAAEESPLLVAPRDQRQRAKQRDSLRSSSWSFEHQQELTPENSAAKSTFGSAIQKVGLNSWSVLLKLP